MYVRYTRHFEANGRGKHSIEIYERYTKNEGLLDLKEQRTSPRIAECLKGINLPKVQLETIKELARNKEDGVVHPDGHYTRY